MSAEELRAGASLAGIFGLRMLGLFLILPVFAVHAPQLAGGDDLVLVGIALGVYGLVQAMLQIPFGMASDRWGRKPMIVGGLEEESRVAYEIGPYRLEIDTAGEPAKGPEDVPVTIVEFSDFECPFCSRVEPTLDRVTESFGDQVRLVFKQFPLRQIHPNAQKAAEASLCAHDQGKFWQMHDAMFADQRNLAVPALKAKAEELGLDTAAFGQCQDSGKYADAVQEDLEQGSEVGVGGTPALFVNGRFLSGAVPYEQIAQVIEDELER